MRFSAFSLFMLSPLLSLTARRTARRCFLTQAFQQSVGGVTHQHRNLEELFSKSRSTTLRTFASSSSSTTVEDDLDAALDNLLDDALYEAENPIQQGKNHIQGSRPMPPTLVEKIDYNDPELRSTSNPRWIQAGMNPRIIDALSAKGITMFTPVQAEAFDPVVARRDVIGRSRTGTGKTLAFGLPAITRLVEFTQAMGKRDEQGRMARGRKVSMLVLCPTRELARQVQEELGQVSRPVGFFTEVFHGGVSYDPQARALKQGIDILVGTPGRIMDHMQRGTLDLSECDIVVLDEADEMLNMGFAEDVEVILKGVGSANPEKTQCLLFSATTPPWVKQIGKKYQEDVLAIDSTTEEGGARVAKTVRHVAIQLPPGVEAKRSILEDIIAVHISSSTGYESDEEDLSHNPIAQEARANRKKGNEAMQQKIFGKTIVFTETKREADELVSGGVFKSLTAQALHGDVGQKQRDATLNAFRQGAFNVLVATDVAARGIDIRDVDLVVQFDPPRDVDTYVHRSGRTGRAGQKGVSILLFNNRQARDIVRIERDLGHGFQFELTGPPSTKAALMAAAKTSALASSGIPEETAKYFRESAEALLEDTEDPVGVVARCLAAISRRSTEVQSRSLITGESGMATIEMSNTRGHPVAPNDVLFTIGKLARMSRRDNENNSFESDVGKIQANPDTGKAIFDMSLEDAEKLVEFSKNVDTGDNIFQIIHELEIERDRNFGRDIGNNRGGGMSRDRFGRGGGGGGRRVFNDSRGGGGGDRGPRGGRGGYHRQNQGPDREFRGRRESGGREGGRDGFRGRYESRGGDGGRSSNTNSNRNGGW